MTYWAEVILPEDETDDPHVIDGDITRYGNLQRIERVAGNPHSHRERVNFYPADGDPFTKKCVFLKSGQSHD
jgi:hypothetical protein